MLEKREVVKEDKESEIEYFGTLVNVYVYCKDPLDGTDIISKIRVSN